MDLTLKIVWDEAQQLSRVGASEASPLSMRVVARKSGAHSSVCRQRHTPSIAWGTRAVPLAIQWGGFFMLHAQPIWRAFVHPVLFSETGRRNQNSKSKSGEFSVVSVFNVTFFFLVTIILPWLNMHRGNATKRRDARAKCRRSCEPEQNSASNDDGSDDDFGIDESHSRRNKGDLKPSKHPHSVTVTESRLQFEEAARLQNSTLYRHHSMKLRVQSLLEQTNVLKRTAAVLRLNIASLKALKDPACATSILSLRHELKNLEQSLLVLEGNMHACAFADDCPIPDTALQLIEKRWSISGKSPDKYAQVITEATSSSAFANLLSMPWGVDDEEASADEASANEASAGDAEESDDVTEAGVDAEESTNSSNECVASIDSGDKAGDDANQASDDENNSSCDDSTTDDKDEPSGAAPFKRRNRRGSRGGKKHRK
mmetsp:Transcript_19698/g.39076  ORF Transcript_19698/g.39076 Transcript_19698/m.39076 type:complete len:429 (-) Transcript_19698:223-1509(-)